jgi:ABC-type lipoprotein export system ATPase subunit
LLLADEPTGALDTRTGEEVMSVLLGLNARGQTVLLVTHNPETAALAGRVLHLRDGRSLSESAGHFTRDNCQRLQPGIDDGGTLK